MQTEVKLNLTGISRRGVEHDAKMTWRIRATGDAIFMGAMQARRGVTRRGFMKGGALALIGTSTIPAFLSRSVMAEVTTAAANKKKLVVLFQRGAVDGLNVVVPYQEKNYYAMRPSIAIQEKDVLDLNGFFGLHPSMAAFKPLYDQGHLAIIHAAGSPDTTRSHFDAQDYMESGTPGVKATPDGWLNRALQAETADREAFGVSCGGAGDAGSADAAGEAAGDCGE